MSDLLKTIATYVPPSIIQIILAGAAPKSTTTEAEAGAMTGAVLFADVSGFTPLTEALAKKGAEGPEELTRLLNTYFSRMIALTEAEGGEVVKFSGDAVTVVFPGRGEPVGHAARRAWQAATAMQQAMDEFATLQTSTGPVALGMKIGIGAGTILTAQVGGVFNRWEYVIAGDPLRQVAEAEHQAERGDIILSPEAQAVIFPNPLPPTPLLQPDWKAIKDRESVERALRRYVPGAITDWLGKELQEWLAVLRPMSVLFIGVGGLDYDQADAIGRLHLFLRSAQEIIYKYEGSINKVAVDDKGTIFIALFGAPPYAHEDDPERALRAALDLQQMADSQNLRLAIGVTTGRVFAGPVGSQTRREYTVMGDTVNVAARLMATAGAQQTRCDHDTFRATRGRLDFEALPAARLKGKAGLIRLYKPLGRVSPKEESGDSSSLVGRKQEIATFNSCLDDVQAGRSRILIVEGEAGIGKSRLVEEFMRLSRERGIVGLLGLGRSIEQRTPYRAWQDIFVTYFALDDIKNPEERWQRVQSQIRDVVPEMAERAPLLNDVLNLGMPENDLTISLDAEVRHESLVSLLLALFKAWALERPLMLILEDAHWLDTLSWDLALQVARALIVARVPLFLVVAMRPLEGESMRIESVALRGMDDATLLNLNSLSTEEILSLAAYRMGLTDGGLPPDVAELIQSRADGNPFLAEELIYTLRDKQLITVVTDERGKTRCQITGDLETAKKTLPDTIQGIVLSRIDGLPPEEQLALKVAAVIGRTFTYTTLHETINQFAELSERMLRNYLDDLRHLDLTPLELPEPELTYIFKHIITQEVAYQTLLFAQRRQIHRVVAEWFHEKLAGGPLELPPETGLAEIKDSPLTPYYSLLAYHWQQANDAHWERHYAWLAGQRAANQFANADAANYFSRALELTPDSDTQARYQLLLARESVNDLRGQREAQSSDLDALDDLIKTTQNKQWQVNVALRRANYAEVVSDYPASLAAAQHAVDLAKATNDPASETEGYIAWGKALWRQGDYDAARAELEQGLIPARATGNHLEQATSLYYLGNVSLYQNNHTLAQTHCQHALEIYRMIGHRQGEANSLNMLGIIHYELGNLSAARDHYEQVLAIFNTIGDRHGEAIVLNNLGNLYCDMGDFETSRAYQEKSFTLRVTIGDRLGEAMGLTNLGLVYNHLGDYQAAREKCEQALVIQQEIGDRSTEGYSLTYLGHALAGLEQWEPAAAAYEAGLNLRRELGQASAAIDDVAGLARVALAQGHLSQAAAHVAEILAWLKEHGTGGIEYPLQAYLTCTQVLQTSDDETSQSRAIEILRTAHTTLMEQANGISDGSLRQSFLENVAANREIQRAWTALEGG
jgi:class 3 adenylate cyclase/predicted ATPase